MLVPGGDSRQRRGYLEDGVLGRFEPGREQRSTFRKQGDWSPQCGPSTGSRQGAQGVHLSEARSREGDGEIVSRSFADVVVSLMATSQDRFPVRAPGRAQWELESEEER